MQDQQFMEQSISQLDLLLLVCLTNRPKTATAWYEAVIEVTEHRIEPGAFERIVARMERRGWIETLSTEQPLPLYQLTDSGLLLVTQTVPQRPGEKLQEGGYSNIHKGREMIMRLLLWILCLYPPAWRERYEEEMVALLEQHNNTFWTGLDLLLGVLRAHLDPDFRDLRQHHLWKRLQLSWKVIGSASVAFGFALVFWFLNTFDLWYNYYTPCGTQQWCQVHVDVTDPLVSQVIGGFLGLFVLILFLGFLATTAGWVLSRIKREPEQNWPRLLSLFALIPLLLTIMTGSSSWQIIAVMAILCVVGVVESGGAFLASFCRTFYHANKGQRTAQRGRATRDIIGLVLGLCVSVCIAPLFTPWSMWQENLFMALWHALSIINTFFLITLAAWILSQIQREPVRNALRLLSLSAIYLIMLFLQSQTVWNTQWSALVPTVACLALTGECIAAKLFSSRKSVSRADEGQRTAKSRRAIRDLISIVFALSILVSMVLLCIALGYEIVAWQIHFPHLPDLQVTLIATLVGMVFATLVALVVCARGIWTLRAAYATPTRPDRDIYPSGTKLSSSSRTISRTDEGRRITKRVRFIRDVISIVFTLSTSVSLVLLCITMWNNFVALQNRFPRGPQHPPPFMLLVMLVMLVGIVLAIMAARVACVRGVGVLRAAYATPKAE